MKLVDLKCPNCDGILRKSGNALICQSCGAAFEIDYDDADVEYEKLRTEAERDARKLAHEKELMEKQYELNQRARAEAEAGRRAAEREQAKRLAARRWVVFGIVLAIVAGGVLLAAGQIYLVKNHRVSFLPSSSEEEEEKEDTPDYNVTVADLERTIEDFIDTGKIVQMGIEECAYWNGTNSVRYYDKTDAKFMNAYLITDIPNTKRPGDSNRLVLFYEVTWHNEDYGDQICYDAVYFSGLQKNPGGGIISNFDGRTIDRSSAAWGWAMAYSFEKYDTCYRENITALGGNVTQVPTDNYTEAVLNSSAKDSVPTDSSAEDTAPTDPSEEDPAQSMSEAEE